MPGRSRRDEDWARAALEAAVRAHHELLDAQERFDTAMWAARSAGVSVRELADAVAMSKSQVSRRYKRAAGTGPPRRRRAPRGRRL